MSGGGIVREAFAVILEEVREELQVSIVEIGCVNMFL